MYVAQRKGSFELAGTGSALLFWRTKEQAKTWLHDYRTDPDNWDIKQVRATYADQKRQEGSSF